LHILYTDPLLSCQENLDEEDQEQALTTKDYQYILQTSPGQVPKNQYCTNKLPEDFHIWWLTNCLWCLWWSVLEHTTGVYQQFTSMLDHFQFSSLANIPANNQSSSFYYIYTAHIHAVPEIISSAVSSNRMQKQQLLQFFYQPCSVNGPSCTSLGEAAWRRLQPHLQDKKVMAAAGDLTPFTTQSHLVSSRRCCCTMQYEWRKMCGSTVLTAPHHTGSRWSRRSMVACSTLR